MNKEKPLWFIKYDPVRTKVFGPGSMRFTSKPFHRMSDAMNEVNPMSMEKAYSFVEWAVVRWTEKSGKVISQGSIEYDS